jgi:hypothetical protein
VDTVRLTIHTLGQARHAPDHELKVVVIIDAGADGGVVALELLGGDAAIVVAAVEAVEELAQHLQGSRGRRVFEREKGRRVMHDRIAPFSDSSLHTLERKRGRL